MITDPLAVPSGPQTPSIHREFSAQFSEPEVVERVTLTQTAPGRNGPPEVAVHPAPTADRSAVIETAEEVAESLPIAGISAEVRPLGPEETLYDPAISPGDVVTAAVRIWRHPLAKAVTHALHSVDGVDDYTTVWNPEHRRLNVDPAVTNWPELAPLRTTVSLESGADPEHIAQAVREAAIADQPQPFVTGVLRETETNTSEQVLSLSVNFSGRDERRSTGSSIYRANGESFAETVVDEGLAEGEKVQLTVTSPPYLDAIDYDAYNVEGDSDWTEFSMNDEETGLWMESQREVFESVFDATREGGFCAVVISHVKSETNEWTPLPHHFAEVMEAAGWTFHERIIWNKPTGGSNRFGTTIQHPYPTYYYPNQQHEEIQVWRRGDVKNRRDEASRLDMTELMKREVSNNVWNIAPVPPNAEVDHPCPFPEEIVHRLTKLYSCEGDVVADPMAGSGTTPMVADRLSRVGVGTELRPKYVSTARERLSSERYERRAQLVTDYEKVGSADSGRTADAEAEDDSSRGQTDLDWFSGT